MSSKDLKLIYVYSALVLQAFEKAIDEGAVKDVILAAGGIVDEDQVKVLLKSASDKRLREVLTLAIQAEIDAREEYKGSIDRAEGFINGKKWMEARAESEKIVALCKRRGWQKRQSDAGAMVARCDLELTKNIYQGVLLEENECRALIELEKVIGRAIPKLERVDIDECGFVPKDTHVIGLVISGLKIQGLPGSIGDLEKLIELRLSSNRLSSLPGSLEKLQKLEKLSIDDNIFEDLPACINELKRLKTLMVSQNKLKAFTFRGLENLEGLDLGFNRLESISVEMPRGNGLKSLVLDNNNLNELPASIGGLGSLEHLSAASNVLKSVPDSLKELKKLRHLRLSNNKLERMCKLPDLKALRKVELKNNKLQDLTDVFTTPLSLESLDLSENEIKRLPNSLCDLVSLKRLDLDGNQLRDLPSPLGKLNKLKFLYVGRNRLTSLPSDLGQLEGLEALKIDNNNINHIPNEICSLKLLRELYASWNHLQELPRDVGKLASLEALYLAGNYLQEIPDSVCDLSRLRVLSLFSNGLRQLPDKIGSMRSLEALKLNENRLGTLPHTIGDLKNLKTLTLRKNSLESLPESFGGLVSLEVLDLYGNELTRLPSSIGDLRSLRELVLSENRLESLPDAVCQMKNLVALDTQGNRLKGFPDGLGDLSSLKRLWASRNDIEKLPASIGNLKALVELWLWQNRLSALPNEIGGLADLRELKLAMNDVAALPESIGNLRNLEVLGLSGNKLTRLPETLGELVTLRELYIRCNAIQTVPDIFHTLGKLKLVLVEDPLIAILIRKQMPGSNTRVSASPLQRVVYFHDLPIVEPERTSLEDLEKVLGKPITLLDFFSLKSGRDKIDAAREALILVPSMPSCVLLNHHVVALNLVNSGAKVLPSTIERLTNLVVLLLGNNNIVEIPTALCNLHSLSLLSLFGNKLKEIPPGISKLNQLTRLELHGNELERLPDSIGDLTSLGHLTLFSNRIDRIPDSIGRLHKLKVLKLQDNAITSLPDSLYELPNLTDLTIYDNKLGPIPDKNRLIRLVDKLEVPQPKKNAPVTLKIFIACDGGVGGCTLAHRIVSDRFVADTSMCFSNIFVKELNHGGVDYSLVFWSMGKQDRFIIKKLQEDFVKGSKGAILMFSLTQPQSTFSLEDRWLPLLRSEDPSLPIILVGNKKDQVDPNQGPPAYDPDFFKQIMEKHGLIGYHETSAKTGEGVEDAVMHLIEAIIEHDENGLYQGIKLKPSELMAMMELQRALGGKAIPAWRAEQRYSFGFSASPRGHVIILRLIGDPSQALNILPPSIERLKWLKELNLNNNLVSDLPDSIGQLIGLKRLYCANNQLKKLPASIGGLTSLEELYLDGNQLDSLPESIGQLKKLRVLGLNGNNLSHLPASIGLLKNLRELHLDNNRIASLPESIGQLESLRVLPNSIAELSKLSDIDNKDRLIKEQSSSDLKRQSSYKLKLLVCGASAVGSSSIIKRFIKDEFQADYKLTIGVDILTKDVGLRNQEIATLSIFDIGSQKRFEFVRTTFYKGASGVIFIFDLTRPETYQEVTIKWVEEVIRNCGNIPYILIGNKVDLIEKLGRTIDPDEAANWATKNNTLYIETSALSGENVHEAFLEITERMVGLKK